MRAALTAELNGTDLTFPHLADAKLCTTLASFGFDETGFAGVVRLKTRFAMVHRPTLGEAMVHLRRLLVVCTVLASGVLAQTPLRSEGDLKALERAYLEAVSKNDTGFIESHVSSNYLGVDNEGHLSDFETLLRARKARTIQVHEYEVVSQTVRLIGDTGIVSECLSLRFVKNSKEVIGDFEVSRVWKKDGEEWKAVFFQSTQRVEPCKP